MQLPGMLANRVACLSKYGSDLTFCDFAFFSPSFLQFVAEVTQGEVKPCGVSARLSLCWPSASDHVTRRHQSTVGFIFPPLTLSLGRKKRPRQPKQPHEFFFLFHLIPDRRIFPLLAPSQVSRHTILVFNIININISVSTAETRTYFAQSWISWKLPSTLVSPHPHFYVYCVLYVYSGNRDVLLTVLGTVSNANLHANKPAAHDTGYGYLY